MRRTLPFLLVCLLNTGALAQEQPAVETQPQGEQNAETSVDPVQEALEPLALGSWVLVSDDVSARIQNATVDAAAARCLQPMTNAPIDNEEADAPTLPELKDLRGDLIYFLSDGTIHRLDGRDGVADPGTEMTQDRNARGEDIFEFSTKRGTLPLYFSNFGYDLTDSGFMVEGRALYLRCPPLADTN